MTATATAFPPGNGPGPRALRLIRLAPDEADVAAVAVVRAVDGAVVPVLPLTVVVVVVVEVPAVAVGLDPAAVGGADHALVLVLAPARGHAVVVLEEVARLVHQRRVAPARQHEPLPAPVVPACTNAIAHMYTPSPTDRYRKRRTSSSTRNDDITLISEYLSSFFLTFNPSYYLKNYGFIFYFLFTLLSKGLYDFFVFIFLLIF